MSDILLEVKNLKQYFPVRAGLMKTIPLKAVDDVSFTIGRGETLGLVGESGCGKTTVGRTILRLYEPTGGEVIFDGESVTAKNITHMRKQMQMVFQDPYSSLNPRMTVEDIIGEPLDVHKLYTSRGERRDKILHLMELVGLNAEHATRYAHEFSGGQRQRIAIARALIRDPEVIVLDEATSALDSISEKLIQEALENLTKGRTTFIVAHRLSTIRDADKIAVLADGHCVEYGTFEELMARKGEFYRMKMIQS